MVNILDTGIPQVKQYMSETNRAVQVSEVAEHLEVTETTAWGVLDLMVAFDIIEKKMQRGRNYYYLKGAYTDEQIKAMLPPEKTPRRKGRRGRPRKPKPPSFKEKYLSDLEERASSGDGLPALALLGLHQKQAEATETPVETGPPPDTEEKPEPLLNIRPFGTVKLLPKNARRLSQTQTRHLKKTLNSLGGCNWVDKYNTVFAEFSALEHGRYGETFYFSLGANSWDDVHQVSVDPSISDYMVLPTIEAKRWESWNDFLTCFNKSRRYSRGRYDEMLDRFIESGHRLVEITVKNRGTTYVKHMLKTKITERGLTDHVEASRVGEWIYLEKVE